MSSVKTYSIFNFQNQRYIYINKKKSLLTKTVMSQDNQKFLEIMKKTNSRKGFWGKKREKNVTFKKTNKYIFLYYFVFPKVYCTH